MARDDIRVSDVFSKFVSRDVSKSGIQDWGLRQTSLEEVFLKIAVAAEQLKPYLTMNVSRGCSPQSPGVSSPCLSETSLEMFSPIPDVDMYAWSSTVEATGMSVVAYLEGVGTVGARH